MEPGNDKYGLLIEHLPDAYAYNQIAASGNNGTAVMSYKTAIQLPV